MFLRSPDAILNAGTSSSARRSALDSSNAVAKNDEAEAPRLLAQLDVGVAVELEGLAMGAVRRPEAVLVVVRAVVQLAGVEAAVVALLELDGVHAGVLRGPDQLARALEAALVVVADLGDHEAGRVVGDSPAVDHELAHGAIVATPQERLDAQDDRRHVGPPVRR